MGLSQLPPEMVAAVAAYLGARDVTACSAVSVGWRRSFNLDRIWRSYCSFNPNYFRQDNMIKPGFEVPYIEGSELDPLCDWRVTFLKELHLIRNWRKGDFTTEEVELQTNTCLYMMDTFDDHNHFMFLCCMTKEGLKLEVWNISGNPFLQNRTKMCNIFRNINETIQNNSVSFKLNLSGGNLLFIYDNLVTVCDFSFPLYQFKFLYNFSILHTAPFFTPRRITHLPEGCLCEVEIIGNRLYGVSYSSSNRNQQFSPSVHVWDIPSATKIKDHCVYEPRGDDSLPHLSNFFLTSGNSQNIVVTRTFEGIIRFCSRIRVLSQISCEYRQFYIQLKSPVIWTMVAGDVVVACELTNPLERNCIFYFYDCATNKCLLKTTSYNIYNPEKISSSGSKFAFMDLHSNITVFDIPTQQMFVSSLHPTRNRLKTITLLNDQLLLLESKYRGNSRSFENILVTSYEVWDFKKQTTPLRLEQCFRSINRTNFTFTKNCNVPSKLLTITHPLFRSITICVNNFW